MHNLLPMTDTDSEILRIRNRLGWSQAEMAEALGLSQATVSRMERGVLPERKAVLHLARSLEEGRAA